jgi:superfamily II DNA or RNA helicase
MSDLRPYQLDLDRKIRAAWASGALNVLATAPTGSGKTVTFSHILANHVGAAVVIAHRQELVEQISLALAREGVLHQIIAPRSVVRNIIALHREELGGCWYDPNSRIAVAGVKTLTSRADRLEQWCQQVTLWVMDEAHHVLRSNGWGQAVELFPNARGLGVTATPERADGKGLGSHADGVFDALVEGPSMRSLIDAGYLTDYIVWVPPSDLDMTGVEVSPLTGDFKNNQAIAAVRRSHIVGSVVEHYLARAAGKRGITFAVDVAAANELAAAFLAAGVPAAAVSAKTPARDRYHTIRRFRAGELLQLVNVDIFGEGFDLPAIEVCSFARPTMSRNLFIQQWGRALRPMHAGKVAIILDHVNNTGRHNGPPDTPRVYTLDRRPKRRRGEIDPDIVPSRTCLECSRPYEAALMACPYCGDEWSAEVRSGPEAVDGDLVQLDRAQLDALYGEIDRVDEDPEAMLRRMTHAGAPYGAAASARKNQRRRQGAQHSLRSLMEQYGAAQAGQGRGAREAQKRFFYRYGVDVLSAQSLSRPDAQRLACKLIDDIHRGAWSA